jgi:hypothetical protein
VFSVIWEINGDYFPTHIDRMVRSKDNLNTVYTGFKELTMSVIVKRGPSSALSAVRSRYSVRLGSTTLPVWRQDSVSAIWSHERLKRGPCRVDRIWKMLCHNCAKVNLFLTTFLSGTQVYNDMGKLMLHLLRSSVPNSVHATCSSVNAFIASIFACGSVWVRNLISNIKGGT